MKKGKDRPIVVHSIVVKVLAALGGAVLGLGVFLTGYVLTNAKPGDRICGVPMLGLACPTPEPPCPGAPFAWTETIEDLGRDPTGTYAFNLSPCETIWFNSGSIQLAGERLGGDIDGQNAVLEYRVTRAARVSISVGSNDDIGHEWWGRTPADFDAVEQSWANRALEVPNCTNGCESLAIFRYLDGTFQGERRYP